MYENLNTSDRVHLIFCDIGNYRHWVKESTTPDKFFSNFDKLIAALKELTTIDYEFLEPVQNLFKIIRIKAMENIWKEF